MRAAWTCAIALLIAAPAAAQEGEDEAPVAGPTAEPPAEEIGAPPPEAEPPEAGPPQAEPPAPTPAPAPATTTPATTTPATTTPATTTPATTTPAAPARADASTPEYARTRSDDDEDEEEEDGGDPYDFLWIQLQGGVSYVDMRAINADNFYPEVVRLRGVGPVGTVAAGFRIEFLSVGLRGALAHYSDDFDVGTVTAEAQLAIPIPVVRPYLRAGFGFGWHGDGDFNAPANSQTTVFGWVFNAAVGLDIFLVEWLSIGAAGSLDILNMSRQSFDEEPTSPTDVMFTETGDAVGIQARGHAGVTFHL